MQFVKVKREHGIRTLDYGWMMKLSTFEELLEYFEKWESSARAVWVDLKRMVKRGSRFGHYTHRISEVVATLAEIKGISPVQAVGNLVGQKMQCMAQILPVYVNHKGGWFHQGNSCEEYEKTEADAWPQNFEPEYKQWVRGRHWYCSVGGKSVFVGGQQKWNTLKAAKEAYKEWAKKRNN